MCNDKEKGGDQVGDRDTTIQDAGIGGKNDGGQRILSTHLMYDSSTQTRTFSGLMSV
jgi:hypothetical protein